MNLIRDAPVDLIVQLLGSWLTLEDICHLDSAVCSHGNRPSMWTIYEVLALKISLKMNGPGLEKQLNWFLKRKIRLSLLQIDYRMPESTFSKVAALFKQSNNQLGSLYVADNDSLILTVAETIIRYCINLKAFTVTEMELNERIFAICGRMNGLEKLEFFRCRSLRLPLEVMRSICLSSLSTLVLTGWFSIAMQKEILRMCPNLSHYYLTDTEAVELRDLPNSLESVHVFNCKSIRVVNLNERLGKLLISCTASTDDDIVEIFSSCSSLQVLSLSNNWRITDATMVRVGNTFGKSLTSLDLYECEAITENGLKYVCEKCQNLVHLTMGGCGYSDPSFITTALDHLPSLRSLCIFEAVVTDALLARVAAAVSLETLDITYVRGCTEKGIMSLVKGCASLKLIAVNDALVTPLVSLMWKELRPELNIKRSFD